MGSMLLYVLFFFSGTTALVYELVWVRQLIFVFGGTTYAITTVLVAFMAGLGLGSYLAGRNAHRFEHPARMFGLLEIGIGVYALLVPVLFGVADPAYRALYPHLVDIPIVLHLCRFVLSGLVVLLPATMMGATLPLLVRHVTMQGGTVGRSVGFLYGVNTIGAVLGVILAGFILLPTLGLSNTTWLAAGVDGLVGVITLLFLGRPAAFRQPAAPTPTDTEAAASAAEASTELTFSITPRVKHVVLFSYAVSGFAAMVYQITWTRALIMSIGSSTYSFTCILAAFILGLALGSLAVARWADRWRNPVIIFGWLELLIGLIATIIVPIHGKVPLIAHELLVSHGDSHVALLVWRFILVIGITSIPTFLMGAILPLVTRILSAYGGTAADVTGRAYAVNTIGTILGSFFAGFVLIRSDVLGVQNSIILASLMNAAVGFYLIVVGIDPKREGKAMPRLAPGFVALILVPIIALSAGKWDPGLMNTAPFLKRGDLRKLVEERTLDYVGEGVDLTVTITHLNASPESIIMTVNGKPDASTNLEDIVTMLLTGHIPALVSHEGTDACIIGLGSGLTLAAVARHPSYERLDCVEISDEVIYAASFFDDYTYNVLNDDPRVNMIRADGRNHLLLSEQNYDLIVSQPSNPWIAGISNLFTREFFELGKQRLKPGGRLAIWLHGYMMSVDDFKLVVHTLFDVFDHVTLWEISKGDYLMIASEDPQSIPIDDFLARYQRPAVRADLYRLAVSSPAHILGRYVTSNEPLREWADGVPVHTDDNALLEFSAPKHMYTDEGDLLEAQFASLQRDVFDDLIAERHDAISPMLIAQTQAVIKARRARVLGEEALKNGEFVKAMKVLLDGCQADPSNLELYITTMRLRQAILTTSRNLLEDPEMAGTIAAIGKLPPPPLAPRKGATLPEVADTFRRLADDAAKKQDWLLAAHHLLQLRELQPGMRGTELSLTYVLIRAGLIDQAAATVDNLLRANPGGGVEMFMKAGVAANSGDADTAIDLLRRVLQTGEVPLQRIATDEMLSRLRGDERFQQLIAPAQGANRNNPDAAQDAVKEQIGS
jgi:spermidine synthase